MQGRKQMKAVIPRQVRNKRNKKLNKRKQCAVKTLPPIPDKRYFTIGEVSRLCGAEPYVLRYWEQEFPQLKPGKRRGNRRFYQYKDVLVIRKIRKLLYEDGYTIEGARSQLTNNAEEVTNFVQTEAVVKRIITELEAVLEELEADKIG